MAPTSVNDLISGLRAALRDASCPLWLPEFTSALADAEWNRLDREFGLTKSSYGTGRMWRRNPDVARQILAYANAPLPYGANHDGIPIELLPEDLGRQCSGAAVRFYSADEILANGVCARVDGALEALATVPALLPTICCLVRSLHLIDPRDDDVDVSFSDPDLPFSAFVSIPGSNAKNGALRIAEAMLHEAMHLQLTLIERLVPLVEPTEQTYFSPWRGEYRTPLGVLHALYVFRGIESFLGAPHLEGPAWVESRNHLTARRAMIVSQVREIEDFAACDHLTPDGAAFAARLLA